MRSTLKDCDRNAGSAAKGGNPMVRRVRPYLMTSTLFAALLVIQPAFAQKPGGILQMPGFASPASMSIHEESTIAAGIPLMGVFNNLVVFDQHVAQNNLASIVPDLASEWSSDETGAALTFRLRQGVKWHDGKPFTAADVKCTWDALAGKAPDKFRVNPRKSWYRNLDEITTNGDYEVTFHLKRPQPYLIALLASGQSPVYPCHVPLRDMRSHPIGTGPFKFVEYKPNEHIRVVRNPDYWKTGRPYPERIDAAAGLRRRQFRHDPVDDPAVEGSAQPGAAGPVRRRDGQQQPRPADQPGETAVRQP